MISRPEAAASWRKCLAEVPFTGICWVSVIHPEQAEEQTEMERYTEKDGSPVLASAHTHSRYRSLTNCHKILCMTSVIQ